jgi:hypothetical protein
VTGNGPESMQPARAIAPPAHPGRAMPTARPATPAGHADGTKRTGLAWLAGAMAALAILAAATAVVSWDAQYVMIARVRHAPAIAALEAGIPDVSAAVFAALGIALALHGRRALRPRILNVGCVGLSVAMNALAAAPGWRDIAIWVMPAAVYALASDTLIGVVRAWAIARTRATGEPLADTDATPLAVAGAILLWLLRLVLAPASTLAEFRRWVIAECPAAPRTRPAVTPEPVTTPPARHPTLRPSAANGKPRKQDLLIALAGQRHDLNGIPLHQVAAIATAIGRDIGLHPGTARRILRAHVRTVQEHHAGAAPGEAVPAR